MAATDARLKKLYEAALEHHSKTGEILEEIGKALNGGKGIGDTMKELERDLSEIWAARYGAPYVWQYVKDRPAIKRLLKNLSVDEIKTRWANYLKASDKYYVDARHGFGLFSAQVNRFASIGHAGELELDVAAPADCKHAPRCKTDQEHTRRRSADLRS